MENKWDGKKEETIVFKNPDGIFVFIALFCLVYRIYHLAGDPGSLCEPPQMGPHG
jgi:hypothetical protein